MENPSYDNTFYSPGRHPVKTNVTIDSFRGDILDFGYAKQKSTGTSTDNISMIAEDYCDYHIRYNGKYYAHDGKSGMPITDGGLGQAGGISGYSVLAEKSCGLMVADVTRCGYVELAYSDQNTTVSAPTPQSWWVW